MQIVIDIPEIQWDWLHNGFPDENDGMHAINAILKGTPLPKGHGRLIDADETIQRICGLSCGCTVEECGYEVPCFSVRRINSAPTIIEKEQES